MLSSEASTLELTPLHRNILERLSEIGKLTVLALDRDRRYTITSTLKFSGQRTKEVGAAFDELVSAGYVIARPVTRSSKEFGKHHVREHAGTEYWRK